MQLFNGDEHCPMCRMVVDVHGHHVFACMAGGDKVLEHNEIRNEVHRTAKVAGAQPELEKGGLLGGMGWPGVAGRRRWLRRRGASEVLPGVHSPEWLSILL